MAAGQKQFPQNDRLDRSQVLGAVPFSHQIGIKECSTPSQR
jgi:hypothetical protein